MDRSAVQRRLRALSLLGWTWGTLMFGGCQSTIRFAQPCHGTRWETAATETELSLSFEQRLRWEVQRWLGVPYCHGGVSPTCVDCSGFVYQVFAALGIPIPRTSLEQAKLGQPVDANPLPGDLVFASNGSRIRHVGIYLGKGRVAHASRSRGVVVDSLVVFSSIGPHLSFRRLPIPAE